jgi:hypothetical protein
MHVRRSLSHLGRSVGFVLLLLIGTSIGAWAQPTVSVRGNVGAAFFQSPDLTSQLLNSGTNLGLEADVRVYRGVSITVGGGFDSFTLNEQNARLYQQSGGDLSFLGGQIGLRYTYLNDSDAHPYVAVGAGLYRGRLTNRIAFTEDGERREVAEPAQFNEEGVHLAFGSVFRLDDTYAVFAEPRYVVFDVSEGYSEAFRYFTLRLGVEVQL